MRRGALILIAVLVLAGIAIAIGGAGERAEEAGRFAGAGTCEELFEAFDSEPVSNDPGERAAVGDEYRVRFRQLNCD